MRTQIFVMLLLGGAITLAQPATAGVVLGGEMSPGSNYLHSHGFASAIKDYHGGRFCKALHEFKKTIEEDPDNLYAHYYAAMCYQSLGQVSLAKHEYNIVFSKTNDPSLRHLCHVGLTQIEKWCKHRHYKGNGNNFSRQPVSRLRKQANPWSCDQKFDARYYTGR